MESGASGPDAVVRRKERGGTAGIHVSIIRKEYRGKVYEHALLRQSYREGGKVRKRTVGTLKGLPRSMVEQFRRVLRGETLVPLSDTFEVRRTLPHGHVAAVLGTARRLGLERLLEPVPTEEFRKKAPEDYEELSRRPGFLCIRARKAE